MICISGIFHSDLFVMIFQIFPLVYYLFLIL